MSSHSSTKIETDTSKTQDVARLTIMLIHFYYFSHIIEEFGFTIKIFLYLTTMNYYLNILYFGISLYNSYLHRNNMKRDRVSQSKVNTLFRVCFTWAVVVIILYWGIYFHDPKLLGDKDLPLHFDLFLHGGNLFFLVFDRIIIDRRHRFEERINKKVLLYLTISYFIVIYSLYLSTGISVYPLLAKLTLFQLGILTLMAYVLFLIGNLIYILII